MPDIAKLESNVVIEIQKEFEDFPNWNALSSLTVDEMKNFLSRYKINTREDGHAIFTEFWKLCMEQYNQILKKTATELVQSTINVKNSIFGDKTEDQKEEIENKISQFESEMRKVSWDNINVYTLSGTEFFRTFFCRSVDPSTFGKKTFRDMFEHKGASDQCTLVEKNILESTTDWNVCYICGLPIYDKYNPDSKGIVHHRTRECEHVVCIFPAIGHNSIVDSLKDIQGADPDTLALIDREYQQSHGCCNQTKLDELWIKLQNDSGFFGVNDDALKDTLKKIFSNTKHDCSAVRKFFTLRRQQDFVSERSAAITRQVLTPIVSLINKAKNNWGNLYELIFRIRQIAALRYNFQEIAVAYLTNANPPTMLKQLANPSLVEKNVIMMRLAHTLQPKKICKEVFDNFILYLSPLNTSDIVDFLIIYWV